MSETHHVDTRTATRLLELLGTLKRFVRQELPPFPERKMSEERFRTLLSLKLLGKTQLKALARHDGLSQPAQCIMLNRLVEEGFAERSKDHKDRRRVRYDLSATGRRELDGEIGRRAELLAVRLERLAEHQRTAFAGAVETLLAGIAKMKE